MKASFLLSLAAFAAAALAPAAEAATTYHVGIDTSPLLGSASGPFSLDFQLNRGGPDGWSNTASLNHFWFTNGSPSGTPSTFGGASGNLAGWVSLDDSVGAFNEFFQEFSPTTTSIQFDVTLTSNWSGSVPDLFTVAILDNALLNLPTSDVTGGDTLLSATISDTITIDRSVTLAPNAGVSVSIAPVPEPSTYALFGAFGALALCAWRRLRRKA